MKHMRRILVLFLVLILMSGCTAGKAPETTAASETTAPMETTSAPETTAPAETTAPVETTVPTVATEPVAVVPPVTEPILKAVELTEKGRYEINIFLSNFSEQMFRDTHWHPSPGCGLFRSADADDYEILYFVWHHAKYNRRETKDVQKDGQYYHGIALDTINSLSERFFGRTLTAEDVEGVGENFRVIDGLVCYPEAYGDTYMDMTVADVMYDLGDGTFQVEFTIYTPSDEGWGVVVDAGGIIADKQLYYSAPEQMADNEYFEVYRKGVALVRPKTLDNGRESYELVFYKLLDEE